MRNCPFPPLLCSRLSCGFWPNISASHFFCHNHQTRTGPVGRAGTRKALGRRTHSKRSNSWKHSRGTTGPSIIRCNTTVICAAARKKKAFHSTAGSKNERKIPQTKKHGVESSVAKGVAHKVLDLALCENNTIDDATVATPLPIAPSSPSSVLQQQ